MHGPPKRCMLTVEGLTEGMGEINKTGRTERTTRQESRYRTHALTLKPVSEDSDVPEAIGLGHVLAAGL